MAPEQSERLLEERQYIEALAVGWADAVADRTFDHKKVADWIATWGTEHEAEPPL